MKLSTAAGIIQRGLALSDDLDQSNGEKSENTRSFGKRTRRRYRAQRDYDRELSGEFEGVYESIHILQELSEKASRKSFLLLVGLVFVMISSIAYFIGEPIYSGIIKNIEYDFAVSPKRRELFELKAKLKTENETASVGGVGDISQSLKEVSRDLSTKIGAIESEIKNIDQNYSKDREITEAQILKSIVEKFPAAILVLFLSGILASLYRHSSKLAAHYSTRAEILRLCRKRNDFFDMGKAAELLSAESISFQETKLPTDGLVEIWKEFLRKKSK